MINHVQDEHESEPLDSGLLPRQAQDDDEEARAGVQPAISDDDYTTLHQQAMSVAIDLESELSNSLQQQTDHDDTNLQEQSNTPTPTGVNNLTSAIDLSQNNEALVQPSIHDRDLIFTNLTDQGVGTVRRPDSSMDSEQFVMIFDSPERDVQDFKCKVEEDDASRDIKIKTESDENALLNTHISSQRYNSPRVIKTEFEEVRPHGSPDHDRKRLENVQREPLVLVEPRDSHTLRALAAASSTAAVEADSLKQFTNHDSRPIYPARAIRSNKTFTVQMDNPEAGRLPPSPILTPISDTNNAVGLHPEQQTSRSSSRVSRSTPEALRLSRLQLQLDRINLERDTEQARLDEVANDLEEIKTRIRTNQRLVEDSQSQVKASKAEVAEAHAIWKQTQTKFKEAKDNSLELSDKSLELVKERSEKADQHEQVLDRLTDIIARRNQLKNQIRVAKELAEISQEFADQETQDFVRRVRDLPKIRVKPEKDSIKDEDSDSADRSTTATSDGDIEESSDDDDAQIIDWRNLGGDNITFNQITHLRDRLNMVKSETPPDHIQNEPDEQNLSMLGPRPSASTKIKSEPQDSDNLSTHHIISQSSASTLPSKMSLADIRAHVDQIVYHKEQLDKYLEVARGSKRKADDMTETEKDGDDDKSVSSDSDDGSILGTRRARKRRAVDEPVNYLEKWR